MNQRVGVNHFDGAGRMQGGRQLIGSEYPGGLNAKDRAYALARRQKHCSAWLDE